MKQEKGITLIALIITIIVMLILVGVSVTVALNGGLFSQAKMAKDRTLNERNNELARDNGEVIINGKVYASIADYLADKEKEEGEGEETGETTSAVYQTVDGTIYLIEGEEITLADGTKVDSLPALQTGDTYTQGDYEYKYNQYYGGVMGGWRQDSSQNGWGVKVIDTSKETYDVILSNVFDKPVNNMSYTFSGCTSLIIPEGFIIPDSVTSLYYTFSYCESLTIPEGFTIPDSVTNMSSTFTVCTSLTIPEGFIIPDSVTDLSYTFSYCDNLTSLPTGFVIPNGVTDMGETFANSGLKSLPEGFTIPASVTNMWRTFGGCFELTGTIIINSTTNSYNRCFGGTEKEIILTTTVEGEEQIELLKAIAATGTQIGTDENGNPIYNVKVSE